MFTVLLLFFVNCKQQLAPSSDLTTNYHSIATILMFRYDLPFKVFSCRNGQCENGVEPNYEACFDTEDKAQAYIAEWTKVYRGDVEFYLA